MKLAPENLLKNPHATSGKNDWQIDHGIQHENPPCGCDGTCAEMGHDAETIQCWATAHSWGKLSQVSKHIFSSHILIIHHTQMVDLADKQIDLSTQPPIFLSCWFASRFDQASRMKATVSFRGSDPDDHFAEDVVQRIEIRKPAGSSWSRIQVLITEYSIPEHPVTHIKLTLEGKDESFWAGNYGAKFTSVCLAVGATGGLQTEFLLTDAKTSDGEPCPNPAELVSSSVEMYV